MNSKVCVKKFQGIFFCGNILFKSNDLIPFLYEQLMKLSDIISGVKFQCILNVVFQV